MKPARTRAASGSDFARLALCDATRSAEQAIRRLRAGNQSLARMSFVRAINELKQENDK